MSRKTDILHEPIDDFTLKVIFFFAFFNITDQILCEFINCLLPNISFAIHEMNT